MIWLEKKRRKKEEGFRIDYLRDDKMWTFKKKTKCSAEEEEEEEEKEKEKEEEEEEDEKLILIYQRVYGICI